MLLRIVFDSAQNFRCFRCCVWARKLRDSWGNLPSGIFSGNFYDFGNFDQCINFRYDSNKVGMISGQHCTLMVPFDRSANNRRMSRFVMPTERPEINVGVGTCFPASCDPLRVKTIADEILKAQFNVSTAPYDQSALCSKSPQNLEINRLQMFAM